MSRAKGSTWIDRPTFVSCKQADAHTPSPAPYFAWHEWAERMAKTHKQQRCPGCGLWKIWTPKGDR